METKRYTGALIDPKDPRNIIAGAISGKAVDIAKQPDKLITDISMLPVLDQGLQPACVGFARASILTYFLYKETGIVDLVSPSFGYALAKAFDGIPEVEGTYPRILAQKNIDIGAMLEKDFTRSTSLSKTDYKTLVLDQKMKIKAAMQKISGFKNVEHTEADLVQAIIDKGIVEITLVCDGYWKGIPFKNKYTTVGTHRIFCYGYERTEDDTYFYIGNSWGESWGKMGINKFAWKEFSDKIYDIYTFEDIDNDTLAEVKKIPIDLKYVWYTNLKNGSKGEDVINLQYALKLEECMDISVKADGIFGPTTEKAVKVFQAKYKLGADGIVGPASRVILNSHFMPENAGRLDKWAMAIQIHEGFYAPGVKKAYPLGTLSWRNNNPGNIRYFGKYRSLAVGSRSNFCIFKDYYTGFAVLKSLLKDAATGKSTVYKPDMTLLQFFSTYAPTSDGNCPSTYAIFVAKYIGVPVETPIKNLIN